MRLDHFLSEKEEKRCPYLPSLDDESRMLDLRDQILVRQKKSIHVRLLIPNFLVRPRRKILKIWQYPVDYPIPVHILGRDVPFLKPRYFAVFTAVKAADFIPSS